MKKILILGIVLVLVGIIIFADQVRIHGRLYELEDINNHETIALIFLSAGIAFFVAYLLKTKELKKKSQFKIQEMAFVLVAVIFLFAIIFLFFARFELGGLKDTSNQLREERAITLIRSVASMPELRCSESISKTSESVCLDLDKVRIFNESSSLRAGYKDIWRSSFVSEVAVQEIFPETKLYYIYKEGSANVSYFSYMPLCSRDKCVIARVIVGISKDFLK